MKTMTWEEIEKDWDQVQQRTKLYERTQEAEAMYRYCIGHAIEEVARYIGKTRTWVRTRLDYYAAQIAIGGVGSSPPIVGKHRGAIEDVVKVVERFSPQVSINIKDDGHGNQAIETVEGEDAEEFQPYLNHYIEQGHKPAAATRLAKAEWAAESAVEAGVIKESVNKRNEKVNQILFPKDSKDTFDLDLKMHMARVKSAAAFLDTAKVRNLRRKSTCEMVAEANALWKAQAELVLAHHQPSMET